MKINKPKSRYKIETHQRLVTQAQVIDRETGEIVAVGEAILSPVDQPEAGYETLPGNDQRLAREIATGRAFKDLLKSGALVGPGEAVV